MKLDERKTALSTTVGAAIVIVVIVVIGLVVYAGMGPGSSRTALSGLVSRSSTSASNSTSTCTSSAAPPYSCSSTVSSTSTNSSMSCIPPEVGCSSTSSTSSTSSSSSPSSTGAKVTIQNGAGVSAAGAPGYSPANITVIIGVNNTVTWTNKDGVNHTVASSSIPVGAADFTSALIAPGGTYSYTFTVPGTYAYHCTLHAWMKGTVIVKAAPSPASPK
jgi:plastocyanin